jgi:hypothetical protein
MMIPMVGASDSAAALERRGNNEGGCGVFSHMSSAFCWRVCISQPGEEVVERNAAD